MWIIITTILTGLCYASLLYLFNKNQHYGKALTTTLFILRAIVVGLLVLLFFNPYIKKKTNKIEPATIIIAQDNSNSLVLTKDSTFYKEQFPLILDTLINELEDNFIVDKYLFGNEGMYVVLVAVVGVAQLGTLSVYPMVAKRMTRRQLYTLGTILVLIGYAIFFVAEISIVLIALGAVLVFVGQAFIQTLMLMFLADTVEYGYWKLGKKNESITFSVQPLINKIGGALATGIVSLTLIVSGIKVDGGTVDAIDSEGKLIIKLAMFAIPLLMIVVGYFVYLKKYKISEEFYSGILKDIEAREKALEG